VCVRVYVYVYVYVCVCSRSRAILTKDFTAGGFVRGNLCVNHKVRGGEMGVFCREIRLFLRSDRVLARRFVPVASGDSCALLHGGEMRVFCGEIGPFCREIRLFLRSNRILARRFVHVAPGDSCALLHGREMGIFCGEIGLFCGEIGFVCGAIGLPPRDSCLLLQAICACYFMVERWGASMNL